MSEGRYVCFMPFENIHFIISENRRTQYTVITSNIYLYSCHHRYTCYCQRGLYYSMFQNTPEEASQSSSSLPLHKRLFFLGLSLTWYVVGLLVESIRTDVTACLRQTFAVSYGLVSSYSLILLICLERNTVVKAMHFVIGHTLNRFKYLIIGGTLAMKFMFSIETILFVPFETTISSCSVPNIYSHQYHFFITLMIGTISGIMIMIVCVTVSTSRHIWRIFFTKLSQTT